MWRRLELRSTRDTRSSRVDRSPVQVQRQTRCGGPRLRDLDRSTLHARGRTGVAAHLHNIVQRVRHNIVQRVRDSFAQSRCKRANQGGNGSCHDPVYGRGNVPSNVWPERCPVMPAAPRHVPESSRPQAHTGKISTRSTPHRTPGDLTPCRPRIRMTICPLPPYER
jgi:hypothetical protein